MTDDDLRAPDDEAPAPDAGEAPTDEDEEAGNLGDAASVRGPEEQGLTRRK